MCRTSVFQPQAPIAATIKCLCQAARSGSITEKGKNTFPQRSGNLHEPSQTDTGQRPPERQEKETGDPLMKKASPRSYVQERGLGDGEQGCSQRS